MAGKFINTKYKETIDNITSISKDLLNNPFYKFNDKKPTRVKYWNINKHKSSLDPGSKLAMAETGDDSPLRYNVIEDLFLFGLPRMEINLDNGDFGLEAEGISGDCYLMPNTIEPYAGDFFQIDYMFNGPWLFKVISVDKDTFDNGANVWKLEYKLDMYTDESINKNVVDEFVAIDVQEGTNTTCVVQKKKYLKAVELDDMAATLKKYYLDLFFCDQVQTLIYKWLNESNMYDPFMVEFIIRNGILENSGSDYVYIHHQTTLNNTFSMDYNGSIYRAFELKDKEALSSSIYISQAEYNNSMSSPFYYRFEDYFVLDYRPIVGISPGPYNCRDYIDIFPEELVHDIIDNKEIFDTNMLYQNIFIKYFNNKDLDEEDLENIKRMKHEFAKESFYMIPFIIFVLEYYTKKLLS